MIWSVDWDFFNKLNSAGMELVNVAEFRMKVLFPLRISVTKGEASREEQMNTLNKQMDLAYQRYEPK